MTTTILRRIFPLVSNCPSCNHEKYDRNGHSRDNEYEYRVCKSCDYRFSVPALAHEVITDKQVNSSLVLR